LLRKQVFAAVKQVSKEISRLRKLDARAALAGDARHALALTQWSR
jgi:hypothetical protein